MRSARRSARAETGLVLFTLFIVGSGLHAHAIDADAKSVIASYNQMAFDLYRQVQQDKDNLVVSPYSIGTAMSMARSGARGRTDGEMAEVLHYSIPADQVDSANAAIYDRLNSLQKGTGIQISTANALCHTLHPSLVAPGYRELLTAKYRAEVFAAENVDPINAWVRDKTEGKIDKILEKLSPNSVCVLLNAIYFKGLWNSQFKESATLPGEFHVTEAQAVSVPTMRQTSGFRLVERENFRALLLPYQGEALAMVLVLPKERTGLPATEKSLSSSGVEALLNDLQAQNPDKVRVTLPRFKIESSCNLVPAFQNLGMDLAFSAEKADFGGITGKENAPGLIWISQIQHKAFIEVNEEGSEAAAATAVEFMTRSSFGMAKFEADHPFLFFIVDSEATAILFMGRVRNPLQDS